VQGSAESVVFTLAKPVLPEALVVLRAGAARALADGAERITVDIDDVGVLDSTVISTLISILRDVREKGIAVSLRANRKSILETLHITGLDQVFTVVAGPEPAPPAPKRHRAPLRRRYVASLVAALFGFSALFGARATAATESSPVELVRGVVAQNEQIASYEATIGIDLRLRSFPYLSQHLDGTTYFKRPDNFEIVFRSVPSYAKGFDKLCADIGDPSDWEQRFAMSLVGERTVDGHRDVVIRLVQKVRGMIDHEDVSIDPASLRIDRMEWYYYNGGMISMSQEYQNVGGYTVLAKQHATIREPFVHAAADAVYTDYKTNVAIDDSVFTAKHK